MTEVVPRPSFSWAKALKHWLLAWLAIGVFLGVVAAAHPSTNANKVGELIGGAGPKLFLSVVLLSYLHQTGRRVWFWVLVAPTPVLFVVGFMLAKKDAHPPLPELRLGFSRGCEKRCTEGGGTEVECGTFCRCFWNELLVSQPNDDAVAELLRRATKEPDAFRQKSEPMVLKCRAAMGR